MLHSETDAFGAYAGLGTQDSYPFGSVVYILDYGDINEGNTELLESGHHMSDFFLCDHEMHQKKKAHETFLFTIFQFIVGILVCLCL